MQRSLRLVASAIMALLVGRVASDGGVVMRDVIFGTAAPAFHGVPIQRQTPRKNDNLHLAGLFVGWMILVLIASMIAEAASLFVFVKVTGLLPKGRTESRRNIEDYDSHAHVPQAINSHTHIFSLSDRALKMNKECLGVTHR